MNTSTAPAHLFARLRPLTGAAWPFRILTWIAFAGLIIGWVALAAMSGGVQYRPLESFWTLGHAAAILLGLISFSPLGLLSCTFAVLTFLTTIFLTLGGASC
jgi:hypothetical protein